MARSITLSLPYCVIPAAAHFAKKRCCGGVLCPNNPDCLCGKIATGKSVVGQDFANRPNMVRISEAHWNCSLFSDEFAPIKDDS
jgi:hypothetical protein